MILSDPRTEGSATASVYCGRLWTPRTPVHATGNTHLLAFGSTATTKSPVTGDQEPVGTARFGVLGPLQVIDAHGRCLQLRGERQRLLLAMLLFRANRPVPIQRLVAAIWPDEPPKSWASNLHTYISRLRERIGAVRLDRDGAGYRLRVGVDDLDLLSFRAARDRGRHAVQAGDPEASVAHFRRALGQWRDRPLADLHLPALEPELARLEAERDAVFEDCMDAELAAGRHAVLVGELRAALAEQPLNERLAGQLMVALQRCGRLAEALTLYRDTRATMVAETGIEPGPDLRTLHTRLLRGEPATIG